MFLRHAEPWIDGSTLGGHLEERGVSRHSFLEFCSEMAVILGLGSAAAPSVAKALEAQKRPTVIWLEMQECTGCVESVLHTEAPTIGDLVLDVVSLDYSETLMAAAGHAVEKAKADSMAKNKGGYVLIVTDSVPTKKDGIYMYGGRSHHPGAPGGDGGGCRGDHCARRVRALGLGAGRAAQSDGRGRRA